MITSDLGPGLHPVDGSGVLSRRGDTILLAATSDAPPPVIGELLAAHADVAAHGGDAAALADRVAAVLAAAGDISVVVYGPAGHDAVVAVFGHAWVDVTTRNGEQRLALRQSREGVRSVLPGPVLAVRAGLGEVDPDGRPQYWGQLEQGVVQAHGLVFVAAGADASTVFHDTATAAGSGAPTASVPSVPSAPPHAVEPERPTDVVEQPVAVPQPSAPDVTSPGDDAGAEPPNATSPVPVLVPEPEAAPSPPAANVDRSQPFQSVVLVGEASGTHERTPLPVATVPQPTVAPEVKPPAHPAASAAVQVMGVYCKNGHFDDPAARYCAICGISMAQLTLVPRAGPRPPLGVLVLDDGSIFSLDGDYVLGRDPARNPDVTDGRARPLLVDDANGNISRAHARIHLDGWQVQVIDLGSANGTGVRGPGEAGWQPLPRLVPMTIRPGTEVGFGRRQLRYESHRNT